MQAPEIRSNSTDRQSIINNPSVQSEQGRMHKQMLTTHFFNMSETTTKKCLIRNYCQHGNVFASSEINSTRTMEGRKILKS